MTLSLDKKHETLNGETVEQKFIPGQLVTKPKGYPFPGRVLSAYQLDDGQWRYDIASIILPGLIHIFADKQLEATDKSEWQLFMDFFGWLENRMINTALSAPLN